MLYFDKIDVSEGINVNPNQDRGMLPLQKRLPLPVFPL